jgi:hypothetical protein
MIGWRARIGFLVSRITRSRCSKRHPSLLVTARLHAASDLRHTTNSQCTISNQGVLLLIRTHNFIGNPLSFAVTVMLLSTCSALRGKIQALAGSIPVGIAALAALWSSGLHLQA